MHLVSSFSCMVIQESSFTHSFVGLYRIYYLLWQEQSSVKASIFFIKGRFRPLVKISEVLISKKAHISFSLARLSFWDVSDCTRWHTFTVSHTIGWWRDTFWWTMLVVQCRFFFCCLEIFFTWLIEAIAWLHYHLLLFACLWQLHSVDTFFHIPFLLGTFSAGSLSGFFCLFVLFCFVFLFFCFCFVFVSFCKPFRLLCLF